MTTLDPRGPGVSPLSFLAFVIVALLGLAVGLGIQEWRGVGLTTMTQSQLEQAKKAVQEDPQFAISVFTKLAGKNNPEAQYWLGYMTELGLGLPRDPKRALELYKKAAGQNIVAAETRLGEIYLHGNLVPHDFAQAKAYLKEAAFHGNARAAMLLGRMYRLGLGVAADPTEAYAWLEVAVLKGSAFAQRERDTLLRDLSPTDQRAAIARVKTILAEIKRETTIPEPQVDISTKAIT